MSVCVWGGNDICNQQCSVNGSNFKNIHFYDVLVSKCIFALANMLSFLRIKHILKTNIMYY